MNIFVFDLDSTVTKAELLPEVARAAGMDVDMARLTRQAMDGVVPFEISFRQRFDLLKYIPLARIRQVADAIEIDGHIGKFIREHRKQCVIATGNADLWIKPITDKLGCRVFASHSTVDAEGVHQLLTILYKGDVVNSLRAELSPGSKIIAVGDSANDIPMFEAADFSIAYGGVSAPAERVRRAASLQINDGAELGIFLTKGLFRNSP